MPNPYPDRFIELLDAAEGLVLDCGAGGRADPRVDVTVEYVSHPSNSVQADVLNLPFRSGTFGLVLSQAVLEHVTDPQRAVDEMVRVLAPGGVLYVEVAFLQPVHMAPHHYFNVTPFGLAHLLRGVDVVASGTFGGMAGHWEWIGREAGAREALGATRFAEVAAAMVDVDSAMRPAQAEAIAAGVWATATRRVTLAG